MPDVNTVINSLIGLIQNNITSNGNEEITGQVHRSTLLTIVQSIGSLLNEPDDYLLNQYPEWDDEQLYTAGEDIIIKYQGRLYAFISPIDSEDQTPGLFPTVWAPISALSLAHPAHKDKKLAEGTGNEVSAAEIRAFLDDFDDDFNLSEYVKKDGSTAFTAPQPGVNPIDDEDLATKGYVDNGLGDPVKAGLYFEFDHEDGLFTTAQEICFDVPLAGVWSSLDMPSVTEIYMNQEAVNNAGFGAFLNDLYSAIHNVGGYLVIKWGPYGTALFKIDNSFGTSEATFEVTHLFDSGNFEIGEIDGTYNADDVYRVGVTFILGDVLDNYVKKDGSVPFTAPQPGVDAENDDELATLGQVSNLLNPIPDWEDVLSVDFPGTKDVAAHDGVWILAGLSAGVRRSIDGGENWTLDLIPGASGIFNPGIEHGGGTWLLHGRFSGTYLWRSQDNGDTWTDIDPGVTCSKFLHLSADTWIGFDGINGQIIRSINGGDTWATLGGPTGIGFDSLVETAGYNKNTGRLLAISQGSTPNVRYTDDSNFLAWSTGTGLGGFTVRGVAVNPETNTWVAVGLESGGTNIAVSTDDGATWTNTLFVGGSDNFTDIAFCNGQFRITNASTLNVYRSTDGLAWTLEAANINSSSAKFAYDEPKDTLIAVAQNSPYASKLVFPSFLTEADVINTTRKYTKGQGGTLVALSIASNQTAISAAASNYFSLEADDDTEIQALSDDMPTSIVIFGKQDASGGRVITFDSTYVVKGDEIPAGANEEFDINIQSDGAGRHTAVITSRV